MKTHPAAERYPLMPDSELALLVADMKANGFDKRFPIARLKGKILDGRNRQLAADQAGVKAKYIDLPKDTDADAFVERANEHRRHLSQEWLQNRRAERVERVAEGRKQGESIRAIAQGEGISVGQVGRDLEKAQKRALNPASGVPGGTPDTLKTGDSGAPKSKNGKVTGLDGKEYDAAKPRCEACARAVRTGQKPKAKCADCAELRQEKSEAAEEQDADGTLIPADVAPAFRNAKKFDDLNRLLNQCRNLLDEIKVGPEGLHLRADHIESQIENCKNSVLAAKPAYVCPYCKGGERAKCKGCKGAGYVTRAGYQNAPGGKMDRKYQGAAK